jgi:hypothetical protein
MTEEVAKKVRKKRDEKPIQAFAKGGIGEEIIELRDFPKNITRKDKAVAWAMKQAATGHTNILFYRSCGSFRATPQTVMEFKIE